MYMYINILTDFDPCSHWRVNRPAWENSENADLLCTFIPMLNLGKISLNSNWKLFSLFLKMTAPQTKLFPGKIDSSSALTQNKLNKKLFLN